MIRTSKGFDPENWPLQLLPTNDLLPGERDRDTERGCVCVSLSVCVCICVHILMSLANKYSCTLSGWGTWSVLQKALRKTLSSKEVDVLAANRLSILLLHTLQAYDFDLGPGCSPKCPDHWPLLPTSHWSSNKNDTVIIITTRYHLTKWITPLAAAR